MPDETNVIDFEAWRDELRPEPKVQWHRLVRCDSCSVVWPGLIDDPCPLCDEPAKRFADE